MPENKPESNWLRYQLDHESLVQIETALKHAKNEINAALRSIQYLKGRHAKKLPASLGMNP